MKPIHVYTIEDYPLTIQISNKRKPTYYGIGDKIPKKYKSIRYRFEMKKSKTLGMGGIGKEYLWDTQESAFVIKNIKSKDKPRLLVINSQLIWKGLEHMRMAIRNFLHAHFEEVIEAGPARFEIPEGKRLFIEFEYHGEAFTQDITNHSFVRSKTFEDVLVSTGRIRDDNPLFYIGKTEKYVYDTKRVMIIKLYVV